MALRKNQGRIESADERGLVLRARSGDRDAFGEIYRRYRGPLLRMAMARTADHAQAEEVVQDTFLKAFLALDAIDADRPLGPWLATIAANLVIDLDRTTSRWVPTDGSEKILEREGADLAVETILTAERLRTLKQAIAALPERYQRILLAATLEETSHAELSLPSFSA